MITKKLLASLAISTIAITSANAVISNSNDFYSSEFEYQPKGYDFKMADDWYAKPLRVDAPSNENLKPEIMLIHLYSSGYTGVFNQYVSINCKNPIESHINTSDGEKISLKQSMAIEKDPWNDDYQYRIDRGAVEALFSFYCK